MRLFGPTRALRAEPVLEPAAPPANRHSICIINKLSDETLEAIAIAVAQARLENGLLVNIPLEQILQPQFFAMYPASLHRGICGHS